MAVIVSISKSVSPNTVLLKLKAMDKIRAERMIAAYKKSLAQTRPGINISNH